MKRLAVAFIIVITALSLLGCNSGKIVSTVRSPEDVAGKDIGVFAGTSSFRYAHEAGAAHSYISAAAMMEDLTTGVLDCVLAEKHTSGALTAKVSGVKVIDEPLVSEPMHFAVAKENADLTRAINAALKTMSENGTLKGLLDKYIRGKEYSYTPPADTTKTGTLTLAIPEDFPPYSYINQNGEYSGLDIEIARAVCDIIGTELVVTECAFDELVTIVWYGKADFALGGLHGSEADRELVDFSDSYAEMIQVIIIRK